jgi:hypothetical protein
VTQCDEASVKNNDTTTEENDRNLLWPSSVLVDMVNSYVDQILADPQINIKGIPDSMERIIYTSTIRLTLNTVYEVVSWLHRTQVLGHQLVLGRLLAGPNHKLDIEV